MRAKLWLVSSSQAVGLHPESCLIKKNVIRFSKSESNFKNVQTLERPSAVSNKRLHSIQA